MKTIQQYEDAGCHLKFDASLRAVHAMTDGELCLRGCAYYEKGRCAAYRKLYNIIKIDKPAPIHTETVKQEAARTGLSISEVRRRRNATS